MQPLTVLLGIVFGTLFAIAFGLGVVLLIFWLLQGEYPRVGSEVPELLRAVAMFTILALVSGFSFTGSLRRTRWRWLALVGLVAGLFLVGAYYWPEPRA